jgi:DDE superfamily endonuclease
VAAGSWIFPRDPDFQPKVGRALDLYARRFEGRLLYPGEYVICADEKSERCEPKTGIEPFGRLVEQVMSTEPYASAKTVFWIVDNGSSHAGKTSIRRMQDAYANARLIHLPVHASRLNQIEIYFSILQRKALTPNDFADLDALAARITAFEQHYRQIAAPFQWTFTRAKLDALLARLADREPHLRLAA